MPPSAATKQEAPPTARPVRGPVAAMIQPIAGPPIGVVPWKATCHSAIARPRMLGSALSWMVELPIAMKETLAQPTNSSAA
jgi:hypothetical protein